MHQKTELQNKNRKAKYTTQQSWLKDFNNYFSTNGRTTRTLEKFWKDEQKRESSSNIKKGNFLGEHVSYYYQE